MSDQDLGDLERQQAELGNIISGLGSVAVAFSGGVDSTLLLAACLDVLGSTQVTAYTVQSPLLPPEELESAKQLAASLGARHIVVPFDDLASTYVAENHPRRCYFCKRARFEALRELSAQTGDAVLVHGENKDDAQDYRPGAQAAHELGVRAPLAEAGLSKAQIRELSRRLGLVTWNRPAVPCLATRFPYDVRLTPEGLERVAEAERRMRNLVGTAALRVRDHWPIARIEVSSGEIASIVAPGTRERISQALRSLGYQYVTIDLDGYRLGSMNDQLDQDV